MQVEIEVSNAKNHFEPTLPGLNGQAILPLTGEAGRVKMNLPAQRLLKLRAISQFFGDEETDQMANAIQIVVSQQQGRVPITIFKINGNIDASSADQLQTQADQAFAAGTRNLILDLTEVKYMSSAGLRVLHYIFKLLRSNTPAESDETMQQGLSTGAFKSPHLKLVNPSSTVLEVLTMTGYDMFIEIHHRLKEAVDSF